MKNENNLLTLIKVISALFFENIALDNTAHVYDEIRDVLTGLKDLKEADGEGSQREAIEALRYTAEWMISVSNTTDDKGKAFKFTRENIIQRITLNTHCENEYVEVCKKYLDETVTPTTARDKVTEIMSELRFDKKKSKLKTLVAKANKRLNWDEAFVESTEFIQTMLSELETLNTSQKGEVPGLVGKVDFDNFKEIETVLKKTTESYSQEGILKTGFQGLDRSTGIGGLRRGEFINFGATTHNYKSGMLIDLALNIPHYNDPWMWDETKKPLILRISFENTIAQDIGIMYKKLYEIQNNATCDIASINTRKAGKYLSEYFGIRGYHFKLECYDPNTFNIYDLFDIFNKYIKEGYEIHFVSCDYLSQIAHNTIGERTDAKINKTNEMARNYCYPKGITLATGHQLSTEAQNLQRENTTTFTKKVSTGGWYMDCKSMHTKLDLEYILGIHNHQDGNRYLFISRGKHRGGESTPIKHCHFIRKFEEFGGIVPDHGSDDKTLYKLPELLNTDEIGVWDD